MIGDLTSGVSQQRRPPRNPLAAPRGIVLSSRRDSQRMTKSLIGNSSRTSRGYRWRQFSVRSLFFFVTAVSVTIAWCAWTLHEAREQQIRVEALYDLGASSIWFDYQHDSEGRLMDRWWRRDPPKTTWQHAFSTPLSLSSRWDLVDANMSQFVEHMRHLPTINRVHLLDCPLTDAHIQQLGNLPHLKFILLSNTSATSLGIDELQQLLPECEIVYNQGR